MDQKSGWRTSEFWLSLIAIALGAFVASGLLPSEHPAVKIAGLVVSVLGALGYTKYRSDLKAGALLLCCGLALSACATWQQTVKISLDAAGEAAEGARAVVEPRAIAAGDAIARGCAAAKTPACPALVEHQAKHHRFNLALQSTHTARVLGYSALAAGDKGLAQGWAAQVASAIRTAAELAQAWGVQP